MKIISYWDVLSSFSDGEVKYFILDILKNDKKSFLFTEERFARVYGEFEFDNTEIEKLGIDSKTVVINADESFVIFSLTSPTPSEVLFGDIEDGKIIFERVSWDKAIYHCSRIIASSHGKVSMNDPEALMNKEIDELKKSTEIQRQNRISNPPPMPYDFWDALSCLSEYADNFEEFKALLSPAMDDISDRNLTRLGRAIDRLDGDFDTFGSSGDCVVVYRCMPVGAEIECGDWVALDYDYAKSHMCNVKGDFIVEGMEVDACDLLAGADDNEWIFVPHDHFEGIDSLIGLWSELQPNKPVSYPTLDVEIGKIKRKYSTDTASCLHGKN